MKNIDAGREQLVLNNRWLFDIERARLADLEFRTGDVKLKPVLARALAVLAHSPFIVLSRNHLLNEVWWRLGFDVGESALSQVMANLVDTFAALPPGRPSIKTIPRIGYFLIADVSSASCHDHVVGVDAALGIFRYTK